jgi:RNA polymerase sigma factor (sigma-70 family)
MPIAPARVARTQVADPALHRAVRDMVRRRVPPSEVEDLVQATLAEALESSHAPEEVDALRRWIMGIARHKVADYYRKNRRERPAELPDIEAPAEPTSAKDLMRWVQREVGDSDQAKETLEWMLREGDGEKLQNIAADHQVPAPRIRQRVSRFRRLFRERWAAELAAVAVVALVIGVGIWIAHKKAITGLDVAQPDNSALRVPALDPGKVRAAEMRNRAFGECEAGNYRPCWDGLDQAAGIDPVGDKTEQVVQMRKSAEDALRAPTPAPAPEPTSSNAPVPKAPPTDSLDSDRKETTTGPVKKYGPVSTESTNNPSPDWKNPYNSPLPKSPKSESTAPAPSAQPTSQNASPDPPSQQQAPPTRTQPQQTKQAVSEGVEQSSAPKGAKPTGKKAAKPGWQDPDLGSSK